MISSKHEIVFVPVSVEYKIERIDKMMHVTFIEHYAPEDYSKNKQKFFDGMAETKKNNPQTNIKIDKTKNWIKQNYNQFDIITTFDDKEMTATTVAEGPRVDMGRICIHEISLIAFDTEEERQSIFLKLLTNTKFEN